MSLTVEVPSEVEERVVQEAARRGVAPGNLVAEVLGREFRPRPNVLTAEETKLYEQINAAPPDKTRRRYRQLIKKRRAETITKAEYQELLDLTNAVEVAHAKRLEAVIELAKLRGISFDQMLDEVGLRTQGCE